MTRGLFHHEAESFIVDILLRIPDLVSRALNLNFRNEFKLILVKYFRLLRVKAILLVKFKELI